MVDNMLSSKRSNVLTADNDLPFKRRHCSTCRAGREKGGWGGGYLCVGYEAGMEVTIVSANTILVSKLHS